MLRISLEYNVENKEITVKEDYKELAVFTRCEVDDGKLHTYLRALIDAEHKCEQVRSDARDTYNIDGYIAD